MANLIESVAEDKIVLYMDEEIRVPRQVIADGRRRLFLINEKKKIQYRKYKAYAEHQRTSTANSMRKRRLDEDFREAENENMKKHKQHKREEAAATGDDAKAPHSTSHIPIIAEFKFLSFVGILCIEQVVF